LEIDGANMYADTVVGIAQAWATAST